MGSQHVHLAFRRGASLPAVIGCRERHDNRGAATKKTRKMGPDAHRNRGRSKEDESPTRPLRRTAHADRLAVVTPTISSLIGSVERGDRSSADALFTALYSSFTGWPGSSSGRAARRSGRRPAPRGVPRHRPARVVAFPDRARFMTYAARVMRGLIIDGLRRRQARSAAAASRSPRSTARTSASGPGGRCRGDRVGAALDELAAGSRRSPTSSTSSSSAVSPSPRSQIFAE